jgi:hypothetical protein
MGELMINNLLKLKKEVQLHGSQKLAEVKIKEIKI